MIKTWFVATTIAVTALGVGACNRENEVDVKKNVETALERERLEGVDTDWDRDNRVLHLKGAVDSDQVRARAEAIATQAVGTSGKVANELTLRGATEASADNLDGTLEAHIENLINEDPIFRTHEVEADANNGVVTLTGEVASQADSKRLSDLVSKVPGVQSVVNSTTVNTTATRRR